MGNSLSEIQKKQSFTLQYEITELISFFSFEYEIQESVFYRPGKVLKLLAKSYLNEETRTRQYLNMMSGFNRHLRLHKAFLEYPQPQVGFNSTRVQLSFYVFFEQSCSTTVIILLDDRSVSTVGS